MIRTTPLRLLLPALAAACALLASCDQTATEATPELDIVATVNGVPITGLDVQLESKSAGGHQTEAAPVDEAAVLQRIILQELAYQKAVDAGFDSDEGYQENRRRLEAQVAAFNRKQLSEVFYNRELEKRSTISDAAALKYFEENADSIRADIRVWQIMRRDESLIEQDREALAQGDSFEEVAGERFQNLPQAGSGQAPWDLGYLKWEQIPEVWWNALDDLDVDETSDILRNATGRYWIIKLIDKRENPDISYEDVESKIKAVLKSRRIRQFRGNLDQELLEDARIVYSN